MTSFRTKQELIQIATLLLLSIYLVSCGRPQPKEKKEELIVEEIVYVNEDEAHSTYVDQNQNNNQNNNQNTNNTNTNNNTTSTNTNTNANTNTNNNNQNTGNPISLDNGFLTFITQWPVGTVRMESVQVKSFEVKSLHSDRDITNIQIIIPSSLQDKVYVTNNNCAGQTISNTTQSCTYTLSSNNNLTEEIRGEIQVKFAASPGDPAILKYQLVIGPSTINAHQLANNNHTFADCLNLKVNGAHGEIFEWASGNRCRVNTPYSDKPQRTEIKENPLAEVVASMPQGWRVRRISWRSAKVKEKVFPGIDVWRTIPAAQSKEICVKWRWNKCRKKEWRWSIPDYVLID